MIFISYNHLDQSLVDMIARRLEIEFGRDNIFYDKWSIRPGESIIDEMNKGLEKYSAFFFMLSSNSLKSEMVKKEWQAALMRKVNNQQLKFIPVRIDDSNPPAILADQLYIDLYGEGLDSAIAKMKNVVNNESTYIPTNDAENLIYSEDRISKHQVKVTVKTTMYAEHNLQIVLGVPGISQTELLLGDVSESMTGGNGGHIIMNGNKIEVKVVSLMRPLDNSNPFFTTISTKNKQSIEQVLVGRVLNQEFYPISKESDLL